MKQKAKNALEKKRQVREKFRLNRLVRAAHDGNNSAMAKLEKICSEKPETLDRVKALIASISAEKTSGRPAGGGIREIGNLRSRPYKN